MAKTIIRVLIEADVTIEDNGYMGHDCTLKEIKDWAKKQMSYKTVYIKQGGGEPQPYPARFTLQEVVIKEDG